MLFREVVPEDLLEIEELENANFDNSFNASTLEHELASGASCLVAISEERVAGYAFYRITNGLTDLTRLAVREELRGKGTGVELLRQVLLKSPRTMLCVRKNNPGAQRLYLRNGFHIVGELEHSWVMLTSS